MKLERFKELYKFGDKIAIPGYSMEMTYVGLLLNTSTYEWTDNPPPNLRMRTDSIGYYAIFQREGSNFPHSIPLADFHDTVEMCDLGEDL